MRKIQLSGLIVFAMVLTGCNTDVTQETVSDAPQSGNNSDTRKSTYRAPTQADLEAKKEKAEIARSWDNRNSEYAAARAAATLPTIAVLKDPPNSFQYKGRGYAAGNYIPSGMFRVFMHTETNMNEDQVRSGGLLDALNGSRVISSRGNTNDISYYGVVSYLVDQNTGIPGMRYVGNATPITQPYNWGYEWNNSLSTGVMSKGSIANVKGIGLWFVQKQMNVLPRLNSDYIVLRLSAACPEGGYPFSQVFDNEDTGNRDIADIDLAPGWSSNLATGTQLAFCFVPKRYSSTTKTFVSEFSVRSGYTDAAGVYHPAPPGYTGIFANPLATEMSDGTQSWQTNTLVIDGEDTGFAGEFIWEGLPAHLQARVKQIMFIASSAGAPFISVLGFQSSTTGVFVP